MLDVILQGNGVGLRKKKEKSMYFSPKNQFYFSDMKQDNGCYTTEEGVWVRSRILLLSFFFKCKNCPVKSKLIQKMFDTFHDWRGQYLEGLDEEKILGETLEWLVEERTKIIRMLKRPLNVNSIKIVRPAKDKHLMFSWDSSNFSLIEFNWTVFNNSRSPGFPLWFPTDVRVLMSSTFH